MRRKDKPKDKLPETFSSYEEAGEFWDTHDSTDYLEHLIPVEADVELKRRHFEIEVDEDVIKALDKRARTKKISPGKLANDLLKRQLVLH